jgi:hypothetical protein
VSEFWGYRVDSKIFHQQKRDMIKHEHEKYLYNQCLMDIGVSENGVSSPKKCGNFQGEHDDRPLDFWK